MKKVLIILAYAITVVFLYSCEKRDTTIYIYKNISGVDVTLFYAYSAAEKKTEIPNDNDYSYTFINYPREYQPFGGTTYVRIVFAGEREIIYTDDLPHNENNILDYDYSYVFEPINSRKRRAYYYFTPEMYEQATPIEP